MSNAYPAEKVADALAQLELNGGNLKRTAAEVGVAPFTLRGWRDRVLEVTPELPLKTKDRDFAELWAAKEEMILEIVGQKAHSASFRDLSIFAGIAADKHLDYSQGRKGEKASVELNGATINVQVNYEKRTNIT